MLRAFLDDVYVFGAYDFFLILLYLIDEIYIHRIYIYIYMCMLMIIHTHEIMHARDYVDRHTYAHSWTDCSWE